MTTRTSLMIRPEPELSRRRPIPAELLERAQKCRVEAERCGMKAQKTRDPLRREHLLACERDWLSRARRYAFASHLLDLDDERSEQRRAAFWR
jgi:hypothetical protein